MLAPTVHNYGACLRLQDAPDFAQGSFLFIRRHVIERVQADCGVDTVVGQRHLGYVGQDVKPLGAEPCPSTLQSIKGKVEADAVVETL